MSQPLTLSVGQHTDRGRKAVNQDCHGVVIPRALLASTKGQPAFQAFGIALILVVWINYFSRVTLYAAAYARTAEPAPEEPALVQGPSAAPAVVTPAAGTATASPLRGFTAGAATMAALAALIAILRRKK